VARFIRYDPVASTTQGHFGLRFSQYSNRHDGANWQQSSYSDKATFTLRVDYALASGVDMRATLVRTDLETVMSGSVSEDDYLAGAAWARASTASPTAAI